MFIHNILSVLSINNMENIDFLYFLCGFSSLCSYLSLDSLTSEVVSDETDKSVDDTLSSVSLLDSPIIPPSGSASSSSFSDDEIDAIPLI